jgi:hypothetical protein
MHAQESDQRHPAFRPLGVYHPPTGDETEFRRTWEQRHGHRWVKHHGRYYPASTPPSQMTNRRDTRLPGARG